MKLSLSLFVVFLSPIVLASHGQLHYHCAIQKMIPGSEESKTLMIKHFKIPKASNQAHIVYEDSDISISMAIPTIYSAKGSRKVANEVHRELSLTASTPKESSAVFGKFKDHLRMSMGLYYIDCSEGDNFDTSQTK